MKMIVAERTVIAGKPINAIVFSDGVWFVLNDKIQDRIDDLEAQDFLLYSEELLYQRIPQIKGKLIESEETFVHINEKTGELNINPKHKHLGFSTANTARATNQANVKLNFTNYLLNRPIYVLKISAILICISVLCFTVSWIFGFYILRILFLHVFSILSQRNMYLSGTLNAASVISVAPTRIAVLADFAKWGGNYPIIMIKKVELPKKYREIGKKIPVAGSYSNWFEQPFWDYFNPLPLPQGVENSSVVNEKLREIPIYDWINLNKKLKEINHGGEEGYYPIDKLISSWKDIEDPRFAPLKI